MRRIVLLALALAGIAIAIPAMAGVPTPHRISFQGVARNSSNQPVVTGNVRVRIYDAPTGGALVYDSGAEFNGAVVTGVFDVPLGGGTPLLLDATRQYHLELDINAEEIIGDAASGRQAFWPAGGDLSRPDLEARVQALEALVFAECGVNQFDLNGNPADGCEFTLDANGIYVDPADPGATDASGCGRGPSNTAAGCVPCSTIARGLAEATSAGRTNVFVANAQYAEAITLVNGKNLFGGYRSGTWERQVSATNTILRGESASGNHRRAVVGTGVTSPTILEGFVVFGPNVTGAGGNSYAVYLSNCGGLTLRSNVIIGGVGGPGGDGGTGPNGSDGAAGTAGANAIQSPTSSCSSILNRTGGVGGVLSCSGTPVNGGAGGGNQCTPVPNSEFSGIDGATASGAGGGTGGDAGDDGRLSGGVYTIPPNSFNGSNGGNGTSGGNGTAGTGAVGGNGTVVGANWTAPTGGGGGIGGFGRGGGGGGAGGGADGISPDLDVLGASGGGGGSGACGGSGGSVGGGGGGSFGVFIFTGTAPTIISNTFYRGLGGAGGRGGPGGRGGSGGTGAAGGLSSLLGGGFGGKGGDGGAGGPGGGGGGGAGGIACGIFTSGIGSPAYGSSNSFPSGGSGGTAGPGGLSLGNPGTAGAAGPAPTVVSQ